MRNALFLFCFLSVSALSGLRAFAVDAPSSDNPASVYAPSVNARPLDGMNQMLPIRGSDLPLPTAGANGMAATGQQEPIVEAIPTPTAFQTGSLLLGVILVARLVRKLRLA